MVNSQDIKKYATLAILFGSLTFASLEYCKIECSIQIVLAKSSHLSAFFSVKYHMSVTDNCFDVPQIF